MTTVDNLHVSGVAPLPSPAKFAKTLSRMGIHKSSHVIIYDMNQGAIAAARFGGC